MAQQFHRPRKMILMCQAYTQNVLVAESSVRSAYIRTWMTRRFRVFVIWNARFASSNFPTHFSRSEKRTALTQTEHVSYSEWRHLQRTVSWRKRSYERKWITHFTTLEMWQCGMSAANCREVWRHARTSMTKGFLLWYCLKQRKCDHAVTDRTGTGRWLLSAFSLSRQLMEQNLGSGYCPFVFHSLHTG